MAGSELRALRIERRERHRRADRLHRARDPRLPARDPARGRDRLAARRPLGPGFADRSARACSRSASKRVGLDRVVSVHAVGNDPSGNVMRKIGMHLDRETVHPANGRAVRVYAIDRPSTLTHTSAAPPARRRADRVEPRMHRQPVGERRNGNCSSDAACLRSRAQRFAQARVRAELEVRVAVARIVARAGRRRQREIVGHREQAPARLGRRTTRRRTRSRACRRCRHDGQADTPGVHDAAVCCITISSSRRDVIRDDERVFGTDRRATVGSVALTLATSPSHVRTWSTTCEPDAPSQPPPRRVEPPLRERAPRDRRRAARTARRSRAGSPIRPSAIARGVARSGAHRNS